MESDNSKKIITSSGEHVINLNQALKYISVVATTSHKNQ